MKNILALIIIIIGSLPLQGQTKELTPLLRLNGDNENIPFRIPTSIGKNWNSIDNVNSQIGY